MTTTYSKLRQKPSNPNYGENNFLRKFDTYILAAINFEPSTFTPNPYLGSMNNAADNKNLEELLSIMNKCFYEKIVFLRGEEDSIYDSIAYGKPLAIIGHQGSGKTTIIKSIMYKESQRDNYILSYLDFNSYKFNKKDKYKDIEKKVFDLLFKEFIFKNDNWKMKFFAYALMNDTNWAELRMSISLDPFANSCKSLDDYESYLQKADQSIKAKLLSTQIGVETLINFISEMKKKRFVLCFDNLDHLQWKQLKILVPFIFEMHKKTKSCSILYAIRKHNIRLLLNERLREQKKLSAFQDIAPVEELDIDTFFLKIDDTSVENVLLRRINFIKGTEPWNTAVLYLRNHLKITSSPITTEAEYANLFWNLFDLLKKTFIDGNVVDYCNHSIREIQKIYYTFISYLLLHNRYASELINDMLIEDCKRKTDTTKLRNFFYRFLLGKNCECVPDPFLQLNVYNIYEKDVFNLPLNLLLLLNNSYKNKDNGFTFAKIKKILNFYEITEDELVRTLNLLEEEDAYPKLVFSEKLPHQKFKSDTKIELLPAGKFFLDRFAQSKEYLFWSALSYNLPDGINLTDRKTIEIEDTYDDDFKYSIIIQFFKEILLVKVNEEINYCKNLPKTPSDYDNKGKHQYYFDNFSYGKHFFLESTIYSIMASIKFSSLPNELKKRHHDSFNKLKQLAQTDFYEKKD